jgi:hypothetical protein
MKKYRNRRWLVSLLDWSVLLLSSCSAGQAKRPHPATADVRFRAGFARYRFMRTGNVVVGI